MDPVSFLVFAIVLREIVELPNYADGIRANLDRKAMRDEASARGPVNARRTVTRS